MPGSSLPNSLMRFADFEADLRACRLRKHGIRLKLFKQSFDVLAVLLEHTGNVVTREELRRRLWPDDVLVDFENNLNTAVARLREALGDTAGEPRFIETIPRCGYRFLAPVSAASKPRLLVLPFVNLSGDPTQEYLSDAVTEELISVLANVAPDRLAVIARTTAIRYKRHAARVAKIAQELALDYVVEGSVLRSVERITANIQLIRAADETHLWANRYDAGMGEAFALVSAAAKAIAAQLGISTSAAARATVDPLAYDLYCKGRYHMFRATPDHMAQAKQYFEQAVARSPEFALAYDSLAELYFYQGFLGFVTPRQSCPAGMYHALRALEIDNKLGETHALVGLYAKLLNYDYPEMTRRIAQARDLSPASPLVRTRYAMSLLLPGRVEEAIAELEYALESDPQSPFVRFWLATTLWLARRYEEALQQARILSEVDPGGHLSHFAAGFCYREQRRFDEAIAAHSRAVEISGGSPLMMGWLGLALGQGDRREEARAVLDRLHQIAQVAYVPPTSFAWTHLGLGEVDEAFVWMDRAIEGRDHMMTPIKTYPFFDPLRSDPRFVTLLEKMNLATK